MPNEHIVKSYDSELARLTEEIARMGDLACAQLRAGAKALDARDAEAARAVMAADAEIDALEHEVSHDVIRLLALRQPMARDLREVMAALRISADIERIGDYAKNVAKRTLALRDAPQIAATRALASLAQLAQELVAETLVAYRERNAERAMKVRARDAELDAEYTQLFRSLLTYMMEDPRNISGCTHLLFAAKNIERIGDHATNIAEYVWFIEHGDREMPEREKRDTTIDAR
ncbi:MAG TPA: phosphate signaling complex protein PhoU [Patescibacteria group bacterium]|nr:phosphate signaling complex protein PhoU [Patescibacteria group bacterium]